MRSFKALPFAPASFIWIYQTFLDLVVSIIRYPLLPITNILTIIIIKMIAELNRSPIHTNANLAYTNSHNRENSISDQNQQNTSNQ
ncbi:hypothetical protein MJO29_010152 [Puccinia striiformis f. sp. tritici]|nr:hypothetical protein MJO29_010152 [Puccinia striiformis f. sp. tritici]